jgi:hypothetical protein
MFRDDRKLARIVTLDHQISIPPECCRNLSATFESALTPLVSKPSLNRREEADDLIAYRPAADAGFEVALFQTPGGQRLGTTGRYHNPMRQRGIYGETGQTRNRNPSLTQRVGMAANSQLQNASARDLRRHRSNAKFQSLTYVSGWDGRKRGTSKDAGEDESRRLRLGGKRRPAGCDQINGPA